MFFFFDTNTLIFVTGQSTLPTTLIFVTGQSTLPVTLIYAMANLHCLLQRDKIKL